MKDHPILLTFRSSRLCQYWYYERDEKRAMGRVDNLGRGSKNSRVEDHMLIVSEWQILKVTLD